MKGGKLFVRHPHEDDLLTPGEVAAFFGVDTKTVARWDKDGELRAYLRTPKGHRRFRRGDCEAFLAKKRVA